ncbi:16S rRNA (guanine(966)-N(2))-methyltransferase RsmD [Anoxybacterium hadale]|uniref:16S rRNA (Guanine(966)-N(2))-methyltransferase RsmD n=1 Tax=Anoxybacterium hadale TaxID=3408580 RepID=A0ACD1A8S8_9FIRM|nr:16S rRNA (guanine(966)-N(2))-methyltransferase RsmD [Clostridiales bacterium]
MKKEAAVLRIIAGELKGRRLFTPKDSNIRPTTDKVKESIFSMIAPYLEDAVVIDLFSGTGNLGLEALSRGAERCYFGDKSRSSMELTRQNIAYCKQEDRTVAILGDYEYVLRKIPEKADLIFLDPPYGKGLLEHCLELIAERSLLSEDGIIVAEHGIKTPMEDKLLGFTKIKEKKYGTIVISIYALGNAD